MTSAFDAETSSSGVGSDVVCLNGVCPDDDVFTSKVLANGTVTTSNDGPAKLCTEYL